MSAEARHLRGALRDDGEAPTDAPGDDAGERTCRRRAGREHRARGRARLPRRPRPSRERDERQRRRSSCSLPARPPIIGCRPNCDRPGETRPDDILRTLRAAIDRARQQPRRAATGEQPGQPRADTKQARLIAMLHQGASISEMASELGWLRHTCHGALAGLKKKRGLRIISDKHAGGERVYHIVSA